ncbi:MAG: hypothetical protein RL020_1182 [Pseudomonadota bacterium]|jgi:hypothetical protein
MKALTLHFKIISVLLPLFLAAQPFALAQTGALDGKTFVAELGVKGKSAHEKADVISFKEGKFHSSSCDQYGYSQGTYTVAASGDAATFDVETVSESDGKLQWHGTVKGAEIEGKYTHYPKPGFFRRNPAPVESWFKGTLRQ